MTSPTIPAGIERHAVYAPPRAPLSHEAMVEAAKRRARELRQQAFEEAFSGVVRLVLRALHVCEQTGARAVRRWMPQG